MREDLLGYLLGVLDGPEQTRVARRLEKEPKLQEDLQRLEAQLLPLEQVRWQHDPPAGLVERTCQLVARYRGPRAPWFQTSSVSLSPARGCCAVTRCWTMADAAIAAGIFFAAAMLFFPAVANGRYKGAPAGVRQ